MKNKQKRLDGRQGAEERKPTISCRTRDKRMTYGLEATKTELKRINSFVPAFGKKRLVPLRNRYTKKEREDSFVYGTTQ